MKLKGCLKDALKRNNSLNFIKKYDLIVFRPLEVIQVLMIYLECWQNGSREIG